MVNKKRIKVKLMDGENYIEIEGKKYVKVIDKLKKIDKVEHYDYSIYEELDKEAQKKRLKFIAERLKETISQDDVLEGILMNISLKEAKRIEKILKTKKPKITKQKGCLGVKIDGGKNNNVYIQLFE